MPTSTIPASRARKELFEIIEKVQSPATPYYRLTVKGEGKAIIMSEDEWESWQETMAIMSDPKAVKEIREAQKQFERGEYVTLAEAFPEYMRGSTVQEASAKYGRRVAKKQVRRSKRRSSKK